MIGFAKRATAALMAVAVVFGTLFLEPVFNKDNTTVNAAAHYDSASLVNYATIMGRAVDYGIVSRSFTQRQHIETTLATYKFCLEQNTVFDVDLTTSRTAQFMVGEIGGSQNKMIFDTVTHDQHPAYVENINITLADDIDMSKLQFNNPDKNHYSVNYTYLTKQQIYDAVDGVVSHAIDESAEIVARTHNPDYALESGAVTVDNGGCTIINIDDDKYENNVVYINLSNPEFATLWSKWNDPNNAGGNWLEIDKRSSTVVVFTYEGTDPITVGKTKVIAKDSAYYGSASQGSELQNYDYYTSVTTHSGEMSGHNYYVDNEIAQKVIWNITNSKQVNLNGSSGTFLILADDADVDLSNSPCSGWLVTNGHVVNRCEFHYIYTGANPNLISEGEGQMHFVAHKSFTTKYTEKDNINPYIDNSVYLSAGDYQFIWQEYTDATFKTPYGSSSVCPVDKNSMVDFPTVTVTSDNADSHYKVAANDNRNFYFRITEDPSKTIPGIANSAGYIDVCLNASADNNGHISFKVQSITTCGDNENNLIQYFENGKMNSADNWISVRGNRFDLGAFFNRKIVPGYMNITKTIKGDVTDEDLKGLTFTVTDGDKYTETFNLGKDFVKNVAGVYELKTPITVQDAGKQYIVTETLHTVTGFDVTVSYTVGNTAGSGEEATLSGVSTKADEPTTVAYENNYVAKEMSLDISKATVLSEELAGATIELTGTDPHGKIVVFDESQFTRGKDARFVSAGSSLVFVSGTEASTISGLKDGTYKLHETLVPDSTDGTFTVATDINFKIEDGKIVSTDVNGTNNRYNPGNGAGNDALVLFDDFVKNTPIPTPSDTPTPTPMPVTGYITINKTIEGPVTQEDLDGLSFTVTDGADFTVTYWLGKDFEQNTKTGEYVLKNAIKVSDASKEYTVKETLTTNSGAVVEVSYTVGSKKGTGSEVNLSGVSTDPDEPTVVSYKNSFENSNLPTVEFSKETTGGQELAGAEITLTGKDITGKDIVLKLSNVTAGNDGSIVSVSDTETLTWLSGTSNTIVKGLPDGTYLMHEAATPDDSKYTVATDITFTITNGVVKVTSEDTTVLSIDPTSGNDVITMTDGVIVPTSTPEPTQGPTNTPEPTQGPTNTPEPTQGPTNTPEPTQGPTNTPEPTQGPTNTPEPTQGPTNTPEPTQGPTNTPEPTQGPTNTPEPTQGPTNTPEPTQGPTNTPEPTQGPTNTPEPTQGPTNTPEPTQGPTNTPEPTKGTTNTPEPTKGPTNSPEPTKGPTNSPEPTKGTTNTPDPTATPTSTLTSTATATATPTVFASPTISVTPVSTTMPKDSNKDLEVTISNQDAAGKQIPDTEITFTSLDGKDLSDVEVIQNGKELAKKISDDKSSVTFITGDEGPSTIKGLDAGTYEVIEKNTSAGQTNPAKVTFEIEPDGSLVFNGKETEAGSQITVAQQTGTNNQEGQTLTMVLSADKSSSSNREPNPIPATGETINEMLIATAIIVIMGSMFLFGEGFKRKENKLHK